MNDCVAMNQFSSILLSVRRFCGIGICVLCLAFQCAVITYGQEPAAEPQRAVVQAPSKSYVLEGLVFAVLCAGAIFAVCRSSPRGI